MNALPRHFESNDWMTLVFLGVFVLIVLAKTLYPWKFSNFIGIIGSKKYFTENEKSPYVLRGFGVLLFFSQMLVFALGIYFLVLVLAPSIDADFVLFLRIFIIYGVFIGCKYVVEKMLGTLFSIEKILDTYLFFKISVKNFLAICLIPLLLLMAYFWKPSQWFALTACIVFFLLNLMALALFYQKKHRSISSKVFYFILYLCTLEIAPYFILYKAMA